VAPSSTAFIIGRAIAGIGGSGLFTGGLAIVSAASTKEQRPSKNIPEAKILLIERTTDHIYTNRTRCFGVRIFYVRDSHRPCNRRGLHGEGFLEVVYVQLWYV
jgi:hypothetical protein